jgi:hypothetical protein
LRKLLLPLRTVEEAFCVCGGSGDTEANMKRFSPFFLGTILLFCSSCKDKGTDPGTRPDVVFSATSSGCLGSGFSKIFTVDSMYYVFTDSLIINYSTATNCANDSLRFTLGYATRNDTLTLLITDRASHNSNCLCGYLHRFAFSNLPNDHYVVRSIFSWKQADRTPPYDPFRLITVYDTTFIGDVFRTR